MLILGVFPLKKFGISKKVKVINIKFFANAPSLLDANSLQK
jgi:hypothetical protein